MADRRSSIGRDGEEAALQLYLSRGFRTVARNWRCGIGEIDLVLSRGGLLVFCEVKTRSSARLGGGYEAVTWRKRAKLRALAEAFIQTTGARVQSIRFDVASVRVWNAPTDAPGAACAETPHRAAGARSSVELFEDAF